MRDSPPVAARVDAPVTPGERPGGHLRGVSVDARLAYGGHPLAAVEIDAEEALADLADQAATIAQGLQDKMQLIRKSLVTVALGLVLILCLLGLKAVTA